MKELPKQYDPAAYEQKVYRQWEKSGAFQPASDHDPKLRKKLKPYTIVMPPPNATGVLHVGHAIMLALEDALVRYHRMKGFDTLYLPGTDHAAIATASVVDRELAAEGSNRHDLGRSKFEQRARKLAADNRKIIQNQIRAMGASADWTRDAFTMDGPREVAVKEAFRRLYKKKLIYRGSYMVNWCPTCRTVLSDDEVEHREQEGVLYHMHYGPFVLATTRPETKVGDTAVAVHPNDRRYQKYVGQKVEVRTINGPRKLQVIADTMVDPKFGTGVVKITPFHDPNDYQVARRHDLPALEVIGEDGTMTEAAGKELAGLDRFKARKKMVDWLKANDLLVTEELHRHSVGHCYRSGDVIEPRISKQWFVKVSAIKKQAEKFADDGQLKFVPARFEKTYRDWLGNLHDWCISRQIWFGHPVPAYLKGDQVSLEPKPGYTASTDTLDTWFSSALWPFSTLGWPKETPDFKRFFPGDVLETGYDIIFFWITRMVLMTVALEVKDPESGKLKPPFHTAYLHGLVRDKRGRKFSKSLGNGVDPLDMIDKHGADALRFMLTTSSTPGNDVKFDEERVVGARNFVNKLWNISRFVISQAPEEMDFSRLKGRRLTTVDKGILQELFTTWQVTETAFTDPAAYPKPQPIPDKGKRAAQTGRPYNLGSAGQVIQRFAWMNFADWYLEIAKVQLDDPERNEATKLVMRYALETVVAMLHPYLPFVTEAIWQSGLGKSTPLITEPWPNLQEDYVGRLGLKPTELQPAIADFLQLQQIIEAIRRLRVDHGVPAGKKIAASFHESTPGLATENRQVILRLARLSEFEPVRKLARQGTGTFWIGEITISLKIDTADATIVARRLQGEVEQAKMEVERLRRRLSNKEYATKAPAEVVAQTRDQLAEAEAALAKLESRSG